MEQTSDGRDMSKRRLLRFVVVAIVVVVVLAVGWSLLDQAIQILNTRSGGIPPH